MKTRTMVCAGAVLGAVAFGFATSSAFAAPAPVDRNPAKVADAVQFRAAVESEEDETANCSKSRKRLWVEGEGWVVRKVTICR